MVFCRWALVALAFLIPARASAQELKPIPVLTGDWPPYVSESDSRHGILSELLRLALAAEGYKPVFEFMTFKIAKERTRERTDALTFPWFKTKAEEKDWYIGNEPLTNITYVFFYNKLNKSRDKEAQTLADEAANIKTLDELVKYRIGGVEGYNYQDKVADRIKKLNSASADEIIAFDRLVKGEIDFLPASREVGEYLLDHYFADSRYKIGKLEKFSSKSWPIFVMASRKDPANETLIARLDKRLKEVNATGAITQIETRYNARRKFDEVVRLEGSDKFPIVTGFESKTDVDGYLIPNGTRAIVVDWGKGFLQTGPVDVPRQMFTKSRVRLLDGPLKGRELYVNSLFITFE